MICKHTYLQLEPSPFAELAGFEQSDANQRVAAESITGKFSRTIPNKPVSLFPSPLVLPHDDLNYDPDSPPQDCQEWVSMKSRNKMTDRRRKVLYVARVPQITEEVNFMKQWTTPNVSTPISVEMASPEVEVVAEYLKAFYHGMDTRILPQQLTWTPWETSTRPNRRVSLPKYVGLTDSTQSMTRIRVRSAPDKAFTAQLNLDDILDTAIAILPTDAYALVLLVDHDIYENDDDDFCCGRAYGGSRVAVVQTARYNPALDMREGIDRNHMWPLSHCKAYVDDLCTVEDLVAKQPTNAQRRYSKEGAMRAAIDAASEHAESCDEKKEVRAIWFTRLAKTVSHELGHCFGIAHCFYYACNMQGTAGMKEDVRQPPYLCPVCEAKVSHAIVDELGIGKALGRSTWVTQRCMVLRNFCQTLLDDRWAAAMWRGLEAWLANRIK